MGIEKWEGGIVRQDKKGRKVYVIRRMIGGKRFTISTRRTTRRAALDELAKFESDPSNYCARGEDAVRLTTELVREFRDCCVAKGSTAAWVDRQILYLAWWAEVIGQRDLRRVSLRDVILPALENQPGRRQRIAVIKSFYTWLRTKKLLLTSADDPTADLKSEQARPAQWSKSKVIPIESYETVRAELSEAYRDAIDVLAGTGWHVTEMERFSRGGEIHPSPVENAAAVLLCPLHKNGAPHRTAVSAEVADAARRVRERAGFSPSNFYRAVAAACAKAKVPKFSPGQFRHTIATLAAEAGQAELVPGYLGHRSASTTRRYYTTLAVPPKVTTLR